MKKQEIFDTVAAHLIKQKRRSADKHGCWVYHGVDNLKCAVGCLIPDEIYTPEMEGKNIFALIKEGAIPSFSLDNLNEDYIVLCDLQYINDDCFVDDNDFFDMADLKERLTSTAKKYKLDNTVLECIV